ncbi:MAG: DUF262 domain-containing protein [Flavobacteriales bacterium]|nr:DUF262 domain-containing protein [Flavobacteriales bacterium]
MKIIRNTTPLSDLFNQLKTGELTINKNYQRSGGLWPENARSYFIDTIINDFPFPKVIIRQTVDLKTRKTKREVIDGQQRLLTIKDFIEGKFKLTKVSKNYHGFKFENLDEDMQTSFLAYEISTDNILSASQEEILEIFRRINSYTLPLSKTEQRHATYQGEFKWFISNLTEYFTPFFEKHKTLSTREISRMEDADLLTEITQIILEGIVARNVSKLEKIYKENDKEFIRKQEINTKIIDTLEFIKTNLSDLFESFKIPAYNFYSIFSALFFNKYGFEKNNITELAHLNPINNFCVDIEISKLALSQIFADIESKNLDSDNSDIVRATMSTTHSLRHRAIRTKSLIDAFRLQ